MLIQKGFHCKACNSFLSFPLDDCPVCGDHFFWLVACNDPVPPLDLLGFLQRMVALSGNTVSLEFLHHHDQLWLPPSFWGVCPDGSVLAEYPWILDLVLFQHPTEAQAPPAEEMPDQVESNDPSYRDTAPIPIFVPAPAPPPPPPIDHRPSLGQAASDTPAPPPPPPWTSPPEPELRQKFSETTSKNDFTSSAAPIWSPRDGFVPLMVFLLFCFMSLSYMVLLYHKNQMIPVAIQGSDSVQEGQPEKVPDANATFGPSSGTATAPIEYPAEDEFEPEEEDTGFDPGQNTSTPPEVGFDAGVGSSNAGEAVTPPEPEPRSIEDGGGPVPPSVETSGESTDEPTPPKEAV